MGFYAEHVLPRIIDVACGMKSSVPLRQRVCEGLTATSWRSASVPGSTWRTTRMP